MSVQGPVDHLPLDLGLKSKLAHLEALVSRLQGQNAFLRKENKALTTRLVEFENSLKKKGGLEEITGRESLVQTASTGNSARAEEVGQEDERPLGLECQTEDRVPESTSADGKPYKVKGKRMKKKNAMAGSMSHYCTRHVALKIMYLGSSYQGFASQATSPNTVETELFGALERTRLISGTAAEAKYTRCGRTDKGVSATGQVIALYLRSKLKLQREECLSTEDSENEPSSESPVDAQGDSEGRNEGLNTKTLGLVMGAINHDGDRVAMARASRKEEEQYARTASEEDEFDYVGILNRALPDDIRVLGWCPVPPGFNARFSCFNREYKYFFIGNGLNIDAMKFACKKFEGDHDFSNFCKMDAASVHNYRRTIANFDILPTNEQWGGKSVWIMRVKGTAFLWHQVRCMAAVLFMVGAGHESPTIIDEMLDLKKYVRKPQYLMAPEAPLLLFNCGYQGLSFHCHSDSVRRLRLHLESLLQTSLVNSSLLLEGLLQLPSADSAVEKSTIQRGDSQRRKGDHIPMHKRLTEPTYEERRRTHHSGQLE
ncbi:hypothetical protein M758_7G043000 [Ceratodon purpureus]|nr:hypothetical protein M758_7G043000 [Ceratodon purpureus]